MTNVFEYKPQLQYILEDINSINNIKDQEIKVEEAYIRTMPSIMVDKVEDNLLKIETIKSSIAGKLKNTIARENKELIDESLNDIIVSLTDGDKFINDKIITYNLYKDCKNNPLLSNISNEWERSSSDIDGSIESEVYPYINEIEEDNKLIKSVIKNTLTYDKSTLNNQELRTQELLEIENLIRLRKDLDEAYAEENINIEKVRALRKNVELKDIKFNFRVNMYEALNDIINESSDLIDIILNEVKTSTQVNLSRLFLEQAIEIKKTVTDSSKLKLLLYQSFRSKREKYYSMKKEKDTSTGIAVKKNSEKVLVAYSRMYLDVAMPTVIDIDSQRIEESLAPSLSQVLSGIEDIIDKKEIMIIDFKNNLKASNKKIKDILKLINEKDRARKLYNSI